MFHTENKSWELVELPKEQKSIGDKWVYKTKLKIYGRVDKYKARVVTKGYKQDHGIDYQEMFSPFVRLDTIHLMLSIVV